MKRGTHFKSEIKQVSSKKNMIIALIILVVGLAIYFLYLNYFLVKECSGIECYNNALSDCKKVWVINEDNEYVWRYEILNKEENFCNVEVRLLKIKKGLLNIEDLEGKIMTCKVGKSGEVLPEEDILACSGPLKEELQEIIIDRLHNYLLENLLQLQEGLLA